jgi:uncharacterized coiled-coil protein SlyX
MSDEKEIKTKIGKFKTQTKFIEFIGGKGYINFISNEAIIEGKLLSGLDLEGTKFKLTICDEGTVDLDEVDTNLTTEEQRGRLIEVIEDKTIGKYRNRSVVQELDFLSVQKVKDKFVPLYLAVEYVTPIEKLTSLFDEVSEISDDAMDNLNDLLNSWFEDEDFAKEVQEMVGEENSQVVEDIKGVIDGTFMQHHDTNINTSVNQIEDSFKKMKEDKLNELKSKKTKREEELSKFTFQLSSLEKSIEEAKSDLKLLEDRIDDIQPVEPPIGYYFNVSEKQNETVILEPEIESIIKDKVSKVKGINVEAFMKLFTSGEYHIKIAKKTDGGFSLVEDFKDVTSDVLEKLSCLSLSIDDKKLVYVGEMSWGEMVNKMIKMGFEQSPDFDKLCGSNSYTSTEESKETIKNKKTTF